LIFLLFLIVKGNGKRKTVFIELKGA